MSAGGGTPTSAGGGTPTPQVVDAAGVIEYQEGSIVSREILKRPSGTLTLFAFDSGQGLSEHTTPFDAVVNVVDGVAEVTISGRSYTVKAGEMIIMPANQPHALKASHRFKMLLTMFRS